MHTNLQNKTDPLILIVQDMRIEQKTRPQSDEMLKHKEV